MHYIENKVFISDEKRTIFRWKNNKRRSLLELDNIQLIITMHVITIQILRRYINSGRSPEC